MKKLTVASRNFSKAPKTQHLGLFKKKVYFIYCNLRWTCPRPIMHKFPSLSYYWPATLPKPVLHRVGARGFWFNIQYPNFFVVRTVHFGIKFIMTNVMRKFLIYLSIYFCLTCFELSFSPSSGANVQLRQWFKSPGYGFSARALIPYPGDLNHCCNSTPASEDGLKESPKHVRQK
jgi:hypothetical protein